MSFETILVECSRENSINYEFDPTNTLNTENSKWTNNVNFELKIGDQVSVENLVVHSIGNSESATIEINGEQNENGFVDNQQGFRFLYYVNNNGWNALQLPYIAGYSERDNMKNINQPVYNNNLNFSNFVSMVVYVNTPTTDDVKTMPPRYNAPILTDNKTFNFQHKNFDGLEGQDDGAKCQAQFEDNIFTLYKQPLNLRNAKGDRTYDSCKYILLNKDFKGFYRSSNNDIGGDGEFDDDADDLEPYTQDITFKIDKGFTTPETICNDITEALHATFENPDDEIKPVNADNEPINGIIQGKCYPLVEVNGNVSGNRSPCWSNIAVKDFEKTRGIYNMMKTSIAFDGKFRFDDRTTEYLINRPAIHISGCVCRFKDSTGGIIETSMWPYKRIEYTIKGNYQQAEPTFDNPTSGSFENKTSISVYSMVPKGWLVTSNIKYTEKNVQRLIRYFEGTERYTGDFLDDNEINNDIEKWYTRLDLGESKQGANSDEIQPEEILLDTLPGYINEVANMRNLGVGKIGIPDFDTNDLEGFQSGQIYGGGIPVNPYSINTLLYGMKLGDDGEQYRMLTCPRSQTVRYGQKQYDQSGILTIGDTNLSHHFYNNEFGDGNLTIYSRFRSDYKTFIKQTNTNKPESEWEEGDGEVKHKIDVDQISTEYTNKYGIYGVPTSKYNIDHEVYILCLDDKPLYLFAYADELQIRNGETIRDGNFPEFYRFLTKIQVATEGSDHETYGGYELLEWNDDVSAYAFEKNDDVFIYTTQNHNFKPDHDLSTMTYRNGVKIDFEANINLVVFYVTQTYTWVGLIEDDPDHSPYTQIKLYPIDSMTFSTVGTEQINLFYNYFSLNIQGDITVSSYKGTNLYIVTNPEGESTAPALVPTLEDKSGGDETPNNAYPFLATDNTEICCAFILMNDSYEMNGTSKTLSGCKHLVPSVYQSLFLCSPSFLDNPTVWMLNNQNNNATQDYLSGGYAQKYQSVGASDPTCTFSNALQKATFSQFHTSRILGVSEMPYTDASENSIDTDTLGSVVTKYYGKHYPYYNIADYLTVSTSPAGAGDTEYKINYGENDNCLSEPQYAVSGIMIYDVLGTKTDITNDIQVMQSEDDFNNSLLFKLGFLYTDFFNKYGLQTNLYDSSITGKYDKANRYRNVNFITTNPIIDISVEPFLSVYSSGGGSFLEALPYYQLSFLPQNIPHTIDGGTSEQIIATNKPIKQTSSYYQVRTDLISTKYICKNQQVNTIALGMKEYTSNDFIYCNPTDYGLTVLQDKNISSITTELRLSNGNLAPTNALNSVIYRIRRPIILEDMDTIFENAQQMQKEYDKELKQELKN